MATHPPNAYLAVIRSRLGGAGRLSRITIAWAVIVALAGATTGAQRDSRVPQPALTLAVDAREAPRKILHVRETIAVAPGPVTLLYPEWIPGEHAPSGPVIDVMSLGLSVNGSRLAWRRDLVNMYAIHCDVPAGGHAIDASFDFALPAATAGFSSGASSTDDLLVLSWNQVVLYPSDTKPDDVQIAAALTLPAGWKYATALEAGAASSAMPAETIQFAPVSLAMLVDSPVLSGEHLAKVDLTPASGVRHTLNIVSDSEAALAITPAEVAGYRRLVVEANALFGAHHYDHYDFLYTLSDHVAHFGLEHHQSSDDRLGEGALIDDDLRLREVGLLPHEFVHSWNGKYRRPAGLATGDFSTPMTGDLLWVYEGLTEYLGDVLTARSGLESADEYRQALALTTAGLDLRPGRDWRPLQDTADEAQLLYDARDDWDALRRGTDFYEEGELTWLDADVTIRTLTGGRKSLDDFCRAFHGAPSSGPVVKPYTLDDLVAALNAVAPSDWRGFFDARLDQLSPHPPMAGMTEGGWTLAYGTAPTAVERAMEATGHAIDARFSLGARVTAAGVMPDVIPGTPLARAGVGPGMTIVAVNERKFSIEVLRGALAASHGTTTPLDLLVADGNVFHTYQVDYHGGERYPSLQRDPGRPDLLTDILKPTAAGAR